jgi:hypothetical protein
MARATTKAQVDLVQGETNLDRKFGYVAGDDGGFFFTWLDTLSSTLSSVEEDEIDGAGELVRSDVIAFLRGYLPTTRLGRELWE